jgi:hypothetical protein
MIMQASDKVRAARKEQQRKRLAAKGKKGYHDETDEDGEISKRGFYSSQPSEQVRVEKAKVLRDARQVNKDAQETLQIAEINGEGLEAAREAAVIAALVVQNHENAAAARPGISLSNAGSK